VATKKKASKGGSKGKGAAKGSKGKAKPKASSKKRKTTFRRKQELVGTPVTAGGDGF
jgi:hypothetical protein